MTNRPHPVRKRTGITELNALLLPLVLLVPTLTAVVAQAALVATAPITFEVDGLQPLPVPELLPFERTRRVAAERTNAVVRRATADLDGSLVAEHVEALASRQAVFDRPVIPPRYDVIGHETVEQFARRWRLSRSELLGLNPEIDVDGVQPGDELCVGRFENEARPVSVGRPNRGRLRNGEPMPEGEGWIIRHPSLAYGTRETIDALVHALRVVQAEHPGGQEMLVADISRLGGGRLPPHRSHQSGRDVDLTYYRLTDEEPTFSHTRASELDLPRNWAFLRTLLLEHDVEYIFMGRALQHAIYAYALYSGEHPAFLHRVFESGPDGHRNHRAVIRFASGHTDHMHVRFRCGATDAKLRPIERLKQLGARRAFLGSLRTQAQPGSQIGMVNKTFALNLGKLVIAAAWADGELHPSEINVLKRLLLRVPNVTADDWRELELYLDHPVTDGEVELLLQRVLDGVGSPDDKDTVLSTLRALIEADGVVTPEEEELYETIEAAVDAAATGVVGALGRLLGKAVRSITGKAPVSLREERIDDFVNNPVYFRLSHPEADRRSELELDDDDLRTACLAAAMMARLAQEDGPPSAAELDVLRGVLTSDWSLSSESVTTIIDATQDLDRLDIFRLGEELRQRVDEPTRRDLLTGLYRLALTTDGLAQSEETTLRKIAKCLGLRHQDLIGAKLAANDSDG